MSSTIISRCIEELKLSEPRIDYVLGMLEAVEAMATDRIENVPMAPILRDSGDNKKLVQVDLSPEVRALQEYEKGLNGHINGLG